MNRAVCIRFDMLYTPWNETIVNSYGGAEPAYLIKILLAARDLGAKLQFFASAEQIRAFPSTANVIVGECHHLDAWLKPEPYPQHQRKLLNETYSAFEENELSFEGAAIKSLPDITFNPSIKWLLLENEVKNSEFGTVRIFVQGAISDENYFLSQFNTSPTHDGFLAEIDNALSLHDELVIINLHPALLSQKDYNCCLLPRIVKAANSSNRQIVTLRDWYQLISIDAH